MPNYIIVVLVFLILLGALTALSVGFYLGSTRNKAKFAEGLRAQKEANEQRLLDVQEAQRQALRETRDETAQFRSTIEHEHAERRAELQRLERRLQQKEENYCPDHSMSFL